jgi:hypothetical protein
MFDAGGVGWLESVCGFEPTNEVERLPHVNPCCGWINVHGKG